MEKINLVTESQTINSKTTESRYGAAWKIMGFTSPDQIAAVRALPANENIVVQGSYDHVEQIFTELGIPHKLVTPEELPDLNLDPAGALWINCKGEGWDQRAVDKIVAFVKAGGRLRTTDWGLTYFLERAFPGQVHHTHQDTPHTFMEINAWDLDEPLLQGVFDGRSQAVWWYEGSSHIIGVRDLANVKPMFLSIEQQNRYGTPYVAVKFSIGKGSVFHVVSHFVLQYTNSTTRRHRAPAANFALEKCLNLMQIESIPELKTMEVGELEPCFCSLRLLVNLLLEGHVKARPTHNMKVLETILKSPAGKLYTVNRLVRDTKLSVTDVSAAIVQLQNLGFIKQDSRTLDHGPVDGQAAYYTAKVKRRAIDLLFGAIYGSSRERFVGREEEITWEPNSGDPAPEEEDFTGL
jgi:hypothetical protein